jgi:hypothetical protein
VTGYGFTDAQVAAVRALPGVRAVTALTTASEGYAVDLGAGQQPVTVLAANPVELARAQSGLTAAPRLAGDVATRLVPAGSATAGSDTDTGAPVVTADPLPVQVSAGLAGLGARFAIRLRARTVQVVVVSVVPALAGAPEGSPWVLADGDALRLRTGLPLAPQALLVGVTAPAAGSGGSAGRPADQSLLAATAPIGVQVRTPAGLARGATSSPLVSAVRAGLPAALAVGGAYGATAVALTLLLGARARSRFVAHLRALGLSARQAGALIGLEVLPTAIASLVAGVGAGLGLAWLVLPAADLRPLTGSVLAPPTQVPLVLVLAVVAAFALTVALSVLAAVAAGRAVSPATAARTVEGS